MPGCEHSARAAQQAPLPDTPTNTRPRPHHTPARLRPHEDTSGAGPAARQPPARPRPSPHLSRVCPILQAKEASPGLRPPAAAQAKARAGQDHTQSPGSEPLDGYRPPLAAAD